MASAHARDVRSLGAEPVVRCRTAATGITSHIGWAFGIGLERLTMRLYNIPDIRLFWSTVRAPAADGISFQPPATLIVSHCAWPASLSLPRHGQDARFLSQFSDTKPRTAFEPYSKYPPCYKDLAFWLPVGDFYDNNFFEVVRGIAGDLVENVALVRGGRPSWRTVSHGPARPRAHTSPFQARRVRPGTRSTSLRG